MASPEQAAIAAALSGIEPMPGLNLVGYVVVAEWEEPNGERMLSRLLSEGGNPWQAKGYFYDGLNLRWPEADEARVHHNPGHPDGWMRL